MDYTTCVQKEKSFYAFYSLRFHLPKRAVSPLYCAVRIDMAYFVVL